MRLADMGCVAMLRPLIAFSVAVALLGRPASAAACSCAQRFAPVETHERWLRWTAAGWPPPEELADADGPLLLTVEHAEHVDGLELWVNGQARAFSARVVDDDGLCPMHLVAVVPAEPWQDGDRLRIEDVLGVEVHFLGLSLPEHGYHAPNENYDWEQASGATGGSTSSGSRSGRTSSITWPGC